MLAALGLVCLLPTPASAHGVSLGQSKIRQDGAVVRYELAVASDELSKRLETGPASPGNATDAERKATLLDRRAPLAAYVGREVRVRLGGKACAHRLETIEVERFEGQSYALLSSTYLCPDRPAGGFEVEYDLLFDAINEGERSSHASIADYDLGGESGRFVFERDKRRLTAGGEGALSSTGRFAVLGLKHILSGLDHVLFVLALLIGARSVRGVVKVATAFTAAHSVTLALAALGWVNVPPAIIEPAIALSIVCVAIQNIVQKEPSHRLVVVFGFGLMHGLGFAGALSFGDEFSWSLIGSLLAFNVGIELGQASVILLATPLLLVARRRRWPGTAHWCASGVIALCGVFWFVGRLW